MRPQVRTLMGSFAMALAALAGAPTASEASNCPCVRASALPSDVSGDTLRRSVLASINHERRHRGLRSLRSSSTLSRGAGTHARDMARRNYFSHSDLLRHFAESGYPRPGAGQWVGQDIAWGAGDRARPIEIVSAWMASPPHRKVVLSRRFGEVGIGVSHGTPVETQAKGATYVADFGFRGARRSR